jgi:hypothetical protein
MEARGWIRTIRKKVLRTPAFPLGYRALTTVSLIPFIRLPPTLCNYNPQVSYCARDAPK